MSSKLLLDYLPPTGVPSRIATQDASASAGNTATATFPAATTAGNLLIAVVYDTGGGPAITGGGWSLAGSDSGANIQGIAIFYKVAAGTETTVSASDSGFTVSIFISEYSGFTGTPTLDVTASGGSSTAALTVATGTTATTTYASELAIAAAYIHSTTSFSSWTNSFTNLSHPGEIYVAQRVLSATGTQTTTLTTTGSTGVTGSVIVTFKGTPVTASAGSALLLEDGTSHLLLENDVQLRQSAAYVGINSQTDMTFTLPNAPVVGNMLIATIMYYTGDNPFLTPTGWTLQNKTENGQTGIATIYRVVVGGDTASWDLTVLTIADQNSGYMWEVMGQNATPASAFNQLAVTAITTAGTSITSASITPTILNTMVLSATMTIGTTSTDVATYPAGWSERKFINSTFQPAWAYQKNGYTTDTTTAISYTVSNLPSAQAATVIMAIAPTSAGGTFTNSQSAKGRLSASFSASQTAKARLSLTTTNSQPAKARLIQQLSALSDTLTAVNGSLWTQATAGSATVSYGTSGMSVAFPASSTSATVGSLTSVKSYNLTGSSAYVQVNSVASTATSADSEFRILLDANNWIRFVEEAGTLYAQKMVAGTRSNVASLTYSSTSHKWWKISESGGTITYWTAPDSGSGTPGTWTSFGTTTVTFVYTTVNAYLAGSCFQAETNPGTFTAAGFNAAGISSTIVTNSQPAKARLQVTTSTSQSAKSRLSQAITSSQSAKARLLQVISNSEPAKARLTGSVSASQSAKARLNITLSALQAAKARLSQSFSNSQAAKARLNKSISNSQPAKGRLTASLSNGQPAKARLSANLSTIQPAKGRLSQSFSNSQSTKARLQLTTSNSEPAKARLSQSRSASQAALARLNKVISNSQSALGRLTGSRTASQAAKARLQITLTNLQAAKARLSQAITSSQAAKARLSKAITNSQPAQARLTGTVTATQSAKARLSKSFSASQSALARLAKVISASQPAKARLTGSSSASQAAKARLALPSISNSQPAKARLSGAVSASQSAQARLNKVNTTIQTAKARLANTFSASQPAKARLNQQFNNLQPSKARLSTSLSTAQPAKARLSFIAQATQSAKARLIFIVTATQTAKARLFLPPSLFRIINLTMTVPNPISLVMVVPDPISITVTPIQTITITMTVPDPLSLTMTMPAPIALTMTIPAPISLTLAMPQTSISLQA